MIIHSHTHRNEYAFTNINKSPFTYTNHQELCKLPFFPENIAYIQAPAVVICNGYV